MIDMIKKIKLGYDIVIASRFVQGSRVTGVPFIRNIFSNVVALILGWLFPYPGLKDYSTFYRAYKVSVIKNATRVSTVEELIQGHGFSSMASFLLKLCYIENPKITEVAINLRYDLKEGGSGIKIFKTIKGYLKLIFKMKEIQRALMKPRY
jgi:dolichol-phosphate mannosyltransferase